MISTEVMAVVLLLIWLIFGWAFMSDCDKLEKEMYDDED